MNYTGPDLQLFFSNDYDGNDPSEATWTELEFEKSSGSYAWTESGVIELNDFGGTNCYIGFKYTSTETQAAAWEVDDISLMGFTSQPVLTVTPLNLSGFSYVEGNGPSTVQSLLRPSKVLTLKCQLSQEKTLTRWIPLSLISAPVLSIKSFM